MTNNVYPRNPIVFPMKSPGTASKLSPGHSWSWTQKRLVSLVAKGITSNATKIRSTADLLRVRWLLPHAIFEKPSPGGSMSDLFLWRGDVAGTRFIAENTLALMTAEPIEVRHRLTFYTEDGKFFQELDYLSSDTYTAIEPGNIGLKLGTFIHSTFYDPSKLEAEQRYLLRLQRWHRGYCEYRRSEGSVWCCVHGNFGGVTSGSNADDHRHRLLARPRVKFLYAPQYLLRPGQKVTAYFLNPCCRNQTYEIFFNPKGVKSGLNHQAYALDVPPLGARMTSIINQEGYITCRSRLPICRPIMFVEEEGQTHHFDVFHT
jgi:hypothetical protein